jgi:hypothetical protein
MARSYDGEVLHVVEKFVPPAQELWYDARGNLDQARQEIKARFRSLVEETRWVISKEF